MFIEDVLAFVNTRVDGYKKNYAAEFGKLSLEEQEILTLYLSYNITILVEEYNSQCYKLLSFDDSASSEDPYTVDSDERSFVDIVRNSDKRISEPLSALMIKSIFFQDHVETELDRLYEQLSVNFQSNLMYQALDSISGDPVAAVWEQEQAGLPESLRADLNRLLHINYQLYMIATRFNLLPFPIPAEKSRQHHMINFERIVFGHLEINPFFSDLAEVQQVYAESLDVVSIGLLDSVVNPSLREGLEQLRESRQRLLAELIPIRECLEVNSENKAVVLRMILAHAGFLCETISAYSAYSATSAPIDFPDEKARVFLGILNFEISLRRTRLWLDDGKQYWLPAEMKRPSFINAVTLPDMFNHPVLQKILQALFTPDELQQYITSVYRFLKLANLGIDIEFLLNEHLTNESVFKFAKHYIDNGFNNLDEFYGFNKCHCLESSPEMTELDEEFILMKTILGMMLGVLSLQGRSGEADILADKAELLTAEVHYFSVGGTLPSAVTEVNLEEVISSLRQLVDSCVLERPAASAAPSAAERAVASASSDSPVSGVAVLGLFGGSDIARDAAPDSQLARGASLG